MHEQVRGDQDGLSESTSCLKRGEKRRLLGDLRRADREMDVLVQVLRRAKELGADGVIVHSILNKGTVAGLGDTFGTGGGGGFAVYQINATAISYAQ